MNAAELEHFNLVTARLTQAGALVRTLQSAIDNNGDLPLDKRNLQGSLWAVQALLEQADKSAGYVGDASMKSATACQAARS